MSPLSAIYYIKQNRMRCTLLIFMFILSYVAYLGGLYITNIRTTFDFELERWEHVATVYPLDDDVDFAEFEKMGEILSEEEGITVLQAGVVGSLFTKSIMGFDNMYTGFSFCSVEDFKTYCRVVGIECDFDALKEGSLIMSSFAANNRGMKVGDELKENENEFAPSGYTLDAIVEADGYCYYYIDNGKHGTNKGYIVLADGMSDAEFNQYVQNIREERKVGIVTHQSLGENLDRQLNSMNYIYMFIVVMLAIVMAVTINAAFVGMYQHRQAEFAVYQAIGIGKKRIVGKILGELVLMDCIGLVVGGAMLILGIYLMNQLVLIPQGMMLFYYHPLALGGMLFCNMLVLVPLLVSRSRQLLKADVCEY